MNFQNNPLYGLQTKKELVYLLGVDKRFMKQRYISSHICPAVINQNERKRLVEVPDKEIRLIQRKIKNILSLIPIPDYVFSGVKNRSHVDNAAYHKYNSYFIQLDISAFFPNTTRERVFWFFKYDMNCSTDVAACLTNLTTINLDYARQENIKAVEDFLKEKKIKSRNHLITGAPTSQVLSYLVNHTMFERLSKLAEDNNMIMSIYVDDVTFSSEEQINMNVINKAIRIINEEGYNISKKKLKKRNKNEFKKVTGVIITPDHKLAVPKALQKKNIDALKDLKSNPESKKSRKKLQGLVCSAQAIDKEIFPGIRQFAFDNDVKPNK